MKRWNCVDRAHKLSKVYDWKAGCQRKCGTDREAAVTGACDAPNLAGAT